MRNFLKLTLLWLILLLVHHIAKAQNNQTPFVKGELIVKFKKGNNSSKTSHLSTKMQAQVLKKIPSLELELWKVNQSNGKTTVMELVDQYKNHPDIDFIEPNYLYTISDTDNPNDPEFKEQWGLENTGLLPNSVEGADIDALDAWEIQSESPNIVVGILDTGVDWRHPDLINNIWQNSGEDTNGNGVLVYDDDIGKWVFDPDDINGKDDDGNGYVDDFIGWNFVDNNNQPFDYETFEAGEYVQPHGTHVAGIIGASGDNEIGISGVSKKVQLAPLKFLTDDLKSTGTSWNAAAAIYYAVEMGMQISNNSWGGGKATLSYAVTRSIKRAELNNHLFIAAAGNGGWDKIGDDIIHFYPSNYDYNNIISVGNTNFADIINPSSNYSVYHVDIAAPGTGIYSCIPTESTNTMGAYSHMSGTSMAAPMVAGACALLWEKGMEVFGEVQVKHIKNALFENVDSLPQLKDKVVSGRLNLHKALMAMQDAFYIVQYTNCRMRDSLALRAIHSALELDITDYAWHTNNSAMDEWEGIKLNELGCVNELEIRPNIKKQIPNSIGYLKDLTHLSIIYPNDAIDDNMNISIPNKLFELKKLKHLALINNNITGAIPSAIGQLANLETLYLNNNNLTGNIPVEVWELIKLQNLALSVNQLSGQLSNSVNQLKNLHALVLSYNQFSGNIPAFNDNLKLQIVYLNNNNFSGEIPELLNPHTIHRIAINNNQLTGSLDPLLSWFSIDIDKVWTFNVSHNNLSGCYDAALAKMGRQLLDGEEGIAFSNNSVSDGNQFGENNDWESFILNGNNSCWASKTSQVWPGDMNNDGIVDIDDFVFYDLAVGNTGYSRNIEEDYLVNGNFESNETSSWEAKLCPGWEANVFGVNSKHQDANGDGIVNELDYEVIVANRGQQNPNHISIDHLTFYDNGIELLLKYDEVETNANPANADATKINEFTFKVYVRDAESKDAETVHNLAAKLDFNDLVEIKSYEFIDDCIDPSSLMQISQDKKNLDIYYKRADDVNNADECNEAFARVVIIVIEDIAVGDDKFLKFKVEESINSKNGATVSSTITSNSYSILGIDGNSDLLVQLDAKPERCKYGGSAIADVSGGQGSYTYHWLSEDDALWKVDSVREVEGLESGNYTLTVTDEAGSIQIIQFEIENLLAYDTEGYPLDCETYLETNCPDDLNLTEDIPQDTYNASQYIYTDGIILEGDEVELKAGELIRLNPGFTMENNTSLKIKIENCNIEEE